MLMPFFTEKMSELLERIGTPYEVEVLLDSAFDIVPEYFFISEKGEPLYLRTNANEH